MKAITQASSPKPETYFLQSYSCLTENTGEARRCLQPIQAEANGIAGSLCLLLCSFHAQQKPQAEGDATGALTIQQHRQDIQ